MTNVSVTPPFVSTVKPSTLSWTAAWTVVTTPATGDWGISPLPPGETPPEGEAGAAGDGAFSVGRAPAFGPQAPAAPTITATRTRSARPRRASMIQACHRIPVTR